MHLILLRASSNVLLQDSPAKSRVRLGNSAEFRHQLTRQYFERVLHVHADIHGLHILHLQESRRAHRDYVAVETGRRHHSKLADSCADF